MLLEGASEPRREALRLPGHGHVQVTDASPEQEVADDSAHEKKSQPALAGLMSEALQCTAIVARDPRGEQSPDQCG